MAPPRIERLERVDSTSQEARRRVEAGDALPGLVLVAREQTGGRGRRGAGWITVPGRSLALTAVRDDPELDRPGRVALLVAVACCRALEGLGTPALEVKWPNDVMRGERKAGGILTEVVGHPTRGPTLLVGIGLNLHLQAGDLPAELEQRAGDVGLPPGGDPVERVLPPLLDELERVLSSPEDPRWAADYRRRAWLPGRGVELSFRGVRQRTTVSSVTGEGDLVLTDGRRLPGEHVELHHVETR